MTKAELRKLYLQKRLSLSAGARSALSREVTQLFFSTTDLTRVSFLHTFISIEKFGEVDTSRIIGDIWQKWPQITLVVPRLTPGSNSFENVAMDPNTRLEPNSWQIKEPVSGPLIAAKLIDIVLVPLLCFDDHGNRVGYGKGFYDRFLAHCHSHCQKIGLSLFPSAGVIDDADAYDIALNKCVTPDGIVSF